MSKQWHVQQSTAEQLYEQTPDETVQLIWTDPPFGTDQLQVGSEHSYRDGTVADTLALTDQLGAAIDAAAEAWWRRDYPEYGPWQDAVAERPEWASEIRADCAAELTAATPHLRAAFLDELKRAQYEVESRHHFGFGEGGIKCLCGFESARNRSRTEHITKAILALLEGGGE